jgi:hypothetical protein
MAEIVERAWTPIGSEGFEYYWDPQEPDAVAGKKTFAIYWRHPENGAWAMAVIDRKDKDDPGFFPYLLSRRTMDLEKSYRKQIDASAASGENAGRTRR